MPRTAPKTIAGWHSIRYSLKLAMRFGFWEMWRSLFSKNSCKSCALGMGGQKGGMKDEAGGFPAVCKKSIYAQASDLQKAATSEFFSKHSVDELSQWTPRQLEHSGRLATPMFCGEGESHYHPVSWEKAFKLVSDRLKTVPPDRTFFYASGRSSNEAGYLLQLFARSLGTNNVNNCSFYCHQASGVGLTESLGTGTATIELEDLRHTDLLFLIGANPSSNHPRFMSTLMDIRRRGGKVIVINPAREPGLERFHVPSDPLSLMFGSEIASSYLQPNIGGDVALAAGIAKALFELSETNKSVLQREFIENATLDIENYEQFIGEMSWEDIETQSGLTQKEIRQTALQYSKADKVVFAWAMGLTHHAHGVDNVQAFVNLALLRGMVGKPHSGLLPLRGHSNVQGIGSIGVTPELKPKLKEQMETHYNIKLPDDVGWDTLTCMEAAKNGQVDFAWNLGGNLYGANPDSEFMESAFKEIDFTLYMNTTLNPSHFRGRGKNTLILPVLARDEEPEPTTQESMFSFVRMSDGGLPRLDGPLSEVNIISTIAEQVLGREPVDWNALRQTANVRQDIGSVVQGFERMKDLDRTREEFHIKGRILHEPHFPTATGKATFRVPATIKHVEENATQHHFQLMTIRSEGQFNTVVYEEFDQFRGIKTRDVVLINPEDLKRLGWNEGDRITVKNETGKLTRQQLIAYPIKAGNLMMYYPEANVLVPRQRDERSKTPPFKSVSVVLEQEAVNS